MPRWASDRGHKWARASLKVPGNKTFDGAPSHSKLLRACSLSRVNNDASVGSAGSAWRNLHTPGQGFEDRDRKGRAGPPGNHGVNQRLRHPQTREWDRHQARKRRPRPRSARRGNANPQLQKGFHPGPPHPSWPKRLHLTPPDRRPVAALERQQ